MHIAYSGWPSADDDLDVPLELKHGSKWLQSLAVGLDEGIVDMVGVDEGASEGNSEGLSEGLLYDKTQPLG